MKIFKAFKKILFWGFWSFLILLIGVSAALYFYKDRLINHVISQANQYINTPIDVASIDLNTWDKFPNISMTFHDVYIQESWKRSTDPLLQAERVYVLLNPLDLVLGNLVINQIHLSNAFCYIKINQEGVPNYRITTAAPVNEEGDSIQVNLNKIVLDNTEVHYLDYRRNQQQLYFTSHQEARLDITNQTVAITSSGDVEIRSIKIKGTEYVKNKQVENTTILTINQESNQIVVHPSDILWNGSIFRSEGEIYYGKDSKLTLKVKGVDSNIQTLISLLPEKSAGRFKPYRSTGNIYFDMTLDGNFDREIKLDASFGMQEAEITHPGSNLVFEQMNMTGVLKLKDVNKPEKIFVNVKEFTGAIGGQVIGGNLSFAQIVEPVLAFQLEGAIQVTDLIKMIDNENIASGTGLVSGNILFDGKVNDLKSLITIQHVTAEGDLLLQDVALTFKDQYPPPITVDGKFDYRKNVLKVENSKIAMGSSRWEMTGSFKNILPYFISKDQDLRIEANITNGVLALDELLKPSDQPEDLRFSISEKLNVDVTVGFNEFSLGRFHATGVNGNIKINDQLAFIKNLEFNSMGGKLKLNGLINTKNNLIRINNSTNLDGIHIDSAFYVYNNFGQEWLKAENLSGRVDADVLTDMVFTQALDFFPDSLESDISIVIHDGQLNNFEPMRKLEKFMDDEDLSHLRFSELRNDIHIENKTIFIPNMEVKSNVSNVQISGTHTFDQQIEYHVVVPLKSMQKRNEDAFGAVEEDGSGSKLHLIVAGTTTDYSIEYDTKAVGKKIVADLKKEVKELKNAFKKKEEAATEITLNEEEYFEWDEDTTQYDPPKPRN